MARRLCIVFGVTLFLTSVLEAQSYRGCENLGAFDASTFSVWDTDAGPDYPNEVVRLIDVAGRHHFVRGDVMGQVLDDPGIVPLPVDACEGWLYRVDGGYLIVAIEPEPSGYVVKASMIDDEGGPVLPCTEVIHTSTEPRTAVRGSVFGVSWVKDSATPDLYDIYFTDVDLATLLARRTGASALLYSSRPSANARLETTGRSLAILTGDYLPDTSVGSFVQVLNADGTARAARHELGISGTDAILYGVSLHASRHTYAVVISGNYLHDPTIGERFDTISINSIDDDGVRAGLSGGSCPPGGVMLYRFDTSDDAISWHLYLEVVMGFAFVKDLASGRRAMRDDAVRIVAIRGNAIYVDPFGSGPTEYEVHDCTTELAGRAYYVKDASGDGVEIKCPHWRDSPTRLWRSHEPDFSLSEKGEYQNSCTFGDPTPPPGLTFYRVGI